ncbi:MAG: class I SAM-dependent methyltransferase [Acidisphaera sp.]|nr:class I SAM-dependent methyltransferase [Acidisphaera sp.]
MEPAEYALMDAAEDGMWWYRALHARVGDRLEGMRGRVLDAGCGTGGLMARLRARRPELALVGLEWSLPAARRAAEKSGAPVACGSVNTLPFPAAAFDAAIAADVLCHQAVAPDLALAELRRVLRPGGLLVVNMPAYSWLLSAHDRRVHNRLRQTAGALRTMLRDAGFARPRAGYWNGLLLPLMIGRRKLGRRGASDVARFPPWMDATLHAVTALERHLVLPAGGSVLATAIRP